MADGTVLGTTVGATVGIRVAKDARIGLGFDGRADRTDSIMDGVRLEVEGVIIASDSHDRR